MKQHLDNLKEMELTVKNFIKPIEDEVISN